MEKFNPLEQEVIKWIVSQPIASMTNFDMVLCRKFFNNTYKLAFIYGKSSGKEQAILLVKKCDEEMMKVCISQFLQVVSLLKHLKNEGFINLLLNKVTANNTFLNILHDEWKISNFNGNVSVLNTDGVFLDITDWNIRDGQGNILYTPLTLPSEYYDWALQYLQNVIYSTEDLRILIERKFVTENEEALQIARDSLEKTRESLNLTRDSLNLTRRSLRWTKLAFYVSVVALLIGAFSYNWSTSTITSEQFSIIKDGNKKIIESIHENTDNVCDKLDSINNKVSLDVLKNKVMK